MNTVHDRHMDRAIELARQAMKEGNGPCGCIVVMEGMVLAEGRNLVETTSDPTAHAELLAVRSAASSVGSTDLTGATLYTTMEPCPMCCWAIVDSGISTLVLGARIAGFRTKATSTYSVESLLALTGRTLNVFEGVRTAECKQLRYDALELKIRRERSDQKTD